MIEIGYNQVQEKHITDGSGAASEAKKVYVGNKLAHVHVNDNTEFALRQTLNGYIHEDNDLYAKVRSIKGNTKVWNQLYDNAVPAAIANHKYYISENNSGTTAKSIATTIAYTADSTDRMCIDLTLIYGAGNEPTTVAEFEADFQKWFGRPIGAEPYDAGSLIPFLATGIKSTGFNLWDEEWEVGKFNTTTGINSESTDQIRCKNLIPILPDTRYFSLTPPTMWAMFLDSNGSVITDDVEGALSRSANVHNVAGSIFKTPANAVHMKFYMTVSYSPTYKHDICINLSNPTLNGTYVPYKATTVPIPVTTLTGKQSGSSTSEVIFPDGMKLAGSVKDELYTENDKTYAVKRVGSVDLGSLTWQKGAGPRLIASAPSNVKLPMAPYNLPNAIISYYLVVTPSTNFNDANKVFTIVPVNGNIVVADTTYTDATTFKAAMSGVMLYYELTTPIVYEVDNYTLPLYYLANGTGTEEIVSTATSAPANMDIEYRLRQRVRLVDMGTPGVLWADSDIDITKPDGFCDSPFTYDKSFFSWGNVVGHNPISNTAFDYDWGGVNRAEPWYEGQVYGSTPGSTLTGNILADAQYDAAKAILGGNWRMPSSSEYDNLFSICKFLEADGSDMDTSKTDKRVDMPDGNGSTVNGIYIESTVTGNRLFFSCSGVGNGSLLSSRGSNGNYWSSTFGSARSARNMSFISSGVYPQNSSNRYIGFSIRPVFPISQ